MAINKKYSYNGYDVSDPVCQLAMEKIVDDKETAVSVFKAGMIDAERDYARGVLSQQQYADVQTILRYNHTAAMEKFDADYKLLVSPFKNKTFLDVDPKEFSDSVIIGTSFYQKEPYTKTFPDGVKNCELKECNADNCVLPAGFSLSGTSTNKHFKVQNNQEKYLVDAELKPITPVNGLAFDKCRLSKDPKDIPVEKLAEPITFTHDPDRILQEKVDALKENDAELKAIIEAKEAAPVEEIKVVK